MAKNKYMLKFYVNNQPNNSTIIGFKKKKERQFTDDDEYLEVSY